MNPCGLTLLNDTHFRHRHTSAAYPPDLPEQDGDPSKLSKSVDKSEALFTMYLDRSDEDDRKTTESWKGECDAILIFVSQSYQPRYLQGPLMLTSTYRRVFSQPLSRLFFPFPSRVFSRVHGTYRHSTSETSIIYSPIPPAPSPSSIPLRLIHLHSLRRRPQSWLTLSGS
jgi:hypothetical protein